MYTEMRFFFGADGFHSGFGIRRNFPFISNRSEIESQFILHMAAMRWFFRLGIERCSC